MTGGDTGCFFLKLGSEDQKKEVFIPNYVDTGGNIYSLAGRDGILWCGSPFLPTNSGVKTKKQKKVFGTKSWLRLAIHSCFSSRNETLLTLGGTRNQYFGGEGPEMYCSGTGPVTFFWGTILGLGGTFLAWVGHKQSFGGLTAPKCLPVALGLN